LGGYFEGFDTNVTFRNLFNMHYNFLYICFTKRKLHSSQRYKLWITGGIKVSCGNKIFHIRGAGDLMIAMSNCETNLLQDIN